MRLGYRSGTHRRGPGRTIKNGTLVFLFVTSLLSLTVCAGPAEGSAAPTAAGPHATVLSGESKTALEAAAEENQRGEIADETQKEKLKRMKLTIGNTGWAAALADNTSAAALLERLADGPITISMHDYANMEKVGSLGQSLPRNDEQITTRPGDLILYQGNALVIYYAPNSWNFTYLGNIDSVTQEELREVLGNGDVKVTLSLDEQRIKEDAV